MPKQSYAWNASNASMLYQEHSHLEYVVTASSGIPQGMIQPNTKILGNAENSRKPRTDTTAVIATV